MNRVLPEQLGGNLLRFDSTFGQPAAEIGDQTRLYLSRLLGVAVTTHPGLVGINIRTQGAIELTEAVRFENLLHRCSPSRPDCQENAAGLCRENLRHATVNRAQTRFTRNSPEPGIVPSIPAPE